MPWASMLSFAGALGLVLLYALPGGSYDIVTRQEYGLVIWSVLCVAIALGLLPRQRPARVVLLAAGALAAYAAWTGLSLLWTESSEQTVAELARALDYLGLVVLLGSVLDRSTWRAAAAGLGFGAMVVCAIAVASRLAPASFPVDQVRVVFQSSNRLDYPFGYWNAVAAWGAMSVAFGLGWSTHDESLVRRAISLALVPVACVCTYLTYSRAGAAGIAIALIAVVAIGRNRLTSLVHVAAAAGGGALAIHAVRGAPQIAHATGGAGASSVVRALGIAALMCAAATVLTRTVGADGVRMPQRAIKPLVLGCVLAFAIAGAAFGPHLISKAWHSFRYPSQVTSADPAARLTNLSGSRYNLWSVALDAFDQAPLQGTGAGTYEFWWNRHQRDAEFVLDAHSLWFQNMAELGAPGLLLMLAVVAGAVAIGVVSRQRWRRSVSAGAGTALTAAFLVYVASASVDWMWQATAVSVLAFAGVAVLGARLAKGRWRLRWRLRMALAAAAAIASLIQIPGLLGTLEIRRSQAAERAGNANLALAWARDAVDAEPWAASAYEQRGLVLESAGRLAPAAQDLKRAISHEPTNYIHWLVLARIQTERRLFDAAVHDYEQARRLRPEDTQFIFGVPARITHQSGTSRTP